MLTIHGNQPPIYDSKAGETTPANKAAPVIESSRTGEQGSSERRRQPDRRTRNIPTGLPERRKKSRRSPLLLNAKNRKPERLAPSRGLHIDTAV